MLNQDLHHCLPVIRIAFFLISKQILRFCVFSKQVVVLKDTFCLLYRDILTYLLVAEPRGEDLQPPPIWPVDQNITFLALLRLVFCTGIGYKVIQSIQGRRQKFFQEEGQ